MDPLTQGLLGAAAAQAVFGRRLRRAWLVGAVAGLAPDADVLISSASDPLLTIEYHRQFTHSLVFIPVGGALCAAPFLARRANRAQWRPILGASVLAYATHGLLDAFTTYGTQLLWPFSKLRVAWDAIAIIDPVFTLALLIGVMWAALRRYRAPSVAALLFCALYVASGLLQHHRALEVQARIAEARGHERERGEAFPTLGNQWVWRSLYQADGVLYADRIRVSWTGEVSWTEGTQVPLMSEHDLAPEIRENERTLRDFRRFQWFSNGWIARAPDDAEVIGDVRYSLRTHVFEPIWGVRFRPEAPVPTEWVNRTADRELSLTSLWAEVIGTHPDYRRLDFDGGY